MRYNPKIMGILNITPDSFYDGNKFLGNNHSIDNFTDLLKSDILDVGCESSRPGAAPVAISEQISRLDLALPLISTFKGSSLSIDTTQSDVAKYAISEGFNMINDISAATADCSMLEVVSDSDSEIVLMHMQGSPESMQLNPTYDNIIDDIVSYLEERVKEAIDIGIDEDKIIIDPGIGFGKTHTDNIDIIKNIDRFKSIGFRVLIGHSRKSFLQYNQNTPMDRLSASVGVSAYATLHDVDILRVHDVEETKSMINIIGQLAK